MGLCYNAFGLKNVVKLLAVGLCVLAGAAVADDTLAPADEWEYPILRDGGSIRMKLWGGKMTDWTPDMETKAYGNHWMEELDPSMVMSDREFVCHFTSIVARGAAAVRPEGVREMNAFSQKSLMKEKMKS